MTRGARGPELLGGVEGGGTKFVCAVGSSPADVRAIARIPTTTPAETLGRVIDFFRAHGPIRALGVGSFGPIDLHEGSPTYGFVTTSPKAEWQSADVVGPLRRALGVPVAFDTDVNAAAIAEHRWGAGAGTRSLLYVTVGTGIGGGFVVDGAPLHGLVHPEMGHVPVRRGAREDDDGFAGICPFHGDCLEGVASGAAIAARWGRPAEALGREHEAWNHVARDLGRALATFVLVLSPERIVLGGGVAGDGALLPAIRAHLRDALGGYVASPELLDRIDEYVVTPSLGDRAGVLGAIALASRVAGGAKSTPRGR